MKDKTQKDKQIELIDSIAVKYRPRKFSDIIGNEKNVGVIQGYFSRRQLVKSWGLFGPSGCGKTSTARVMAMAVNCQNMSDTGEPCLKCPSCKMALAGTHVDIKELNAGSEEGKVSGIESILETIKYRPKFNARVIIIDECHLASGKAQQSLLKAVEEPPRGVMFILCTTNPEKLPRAMMGRCVKLYFEYPEAKETAERLYRICKKEYSPEITKRIKSYLLPIARTTQSQVRNSLSVMESLASILFSNPEIEDDKLKSMFENLLMDVSDMDSQAIRYCTFLLSKDLSLPIALSLEIEAARVQEFVSLSIRHAQYAAVFFMYYMNKEKLHSIRRKFWGINFRRYDNALAELLQERKAGILVKDCLRIASGLISAQEKIRTGVISTDQAIIYGITQSIKD